MQEQRCKFRVVGLSATPGADGAKVQVRVRGGASRAAREPLRTCELARRAFQLPVLPASKPRPSCG